MVFKNSRFIGTIAQPIDYLLPTHGKLQLHLIFLVFDSNSFAFL